MPFKRPTLNEIDERIRNDIAGKLRLKGTSRVASLLRRSVVAVLARAYAGACHLLYAFLAWLAKQRFVHSMEVEFLDAEGLTYDIPRKGETHAEGRIRIKGNDGTMIPAGHMYQHEDGRQYEVVAAVAVAEGVAVATVRAEKAGAAGNLLEGETLAAILSLGGVDPQAVVMEDGISDGTDTEADDYYRERILDRKREPPHGGAKHDYEQWAKQVAGVTRAWCLPLWMGKGTVGVMFARDGDPSPFPNEQQRQAVQDHIEKVRPVTAEVFVFIPERQEVNVSLKLSPNDEATREAVKAELADFVLRDGAPDSILHVSRLSEAISGAAGEHHHELIAPMNDIRIAKNAIPVLGNVVFVEGG